MKTIKLKSTEKMPENFTGIVEYAKGTKMWFQDNIVNRIDGPAVEWGDGRITYVIMGTILSKEQFKIFQFMWENTSYRKTKKLMKMFVKLAKMK